MTSWATSIWIQRKIQVNNLQYALVFACISFGKQVKAYFSGYQANKVSFFNIVHHVVIKDRAPR